MEGCITSNAKRVNVRALPLPAQERVDSVRKQIAEVARRMGLADDQVQHLAESARQVAANVYEGDHL